MSSRQSAFAKLVSAGIKYGPLAYEGLKHGRRPAQEFAERQVSRRNARAMAMEHAAHLVHGSVLPVYDGDRRVWVVFSGDRPVGTHPVVTTPIEDLLAHYDLDKRITPADLSGPLRRRRRRSRGLRRSSGSRGSTGTGQPHGAAGDAGSGRPDDGAPPGPSPTRHR